MIAQQILSVTLALSPPAVPAPLEFDSQLDHTLFVESEDDVQFIAYDSAGEVLGVIAIWRDGEGTVHLASDYGDGYAETVVVDGRSRTEATLPPEVIARRAQGMLGMIDYGGADGPDVREGWYTCALAVLAATASCASMSLWCPVAVYGATCACLPLIMEDFQCPGNN